MNTNRRRTVLVGLLKTQALIGAGFLLWIFFAGERADAPDADAQRLRIDTSAMAPDSLEVVRQKNHDLFIVTPSPQALQQLATLKLPAKTTASEPPLRDYRVSATTKVFTVVRIDDHYLLSGRDHWQRDQVCDDFMLQSGFTFNGQVLHIALVCRQAADVIAYDAAGRSLRADIADLEMPQYRLEGHDLVIAP